MKTLIVIVIIVLIAFIIYLYMRKQKTIIKPRPNSSWTNADWLKNGYTQKEIDDYKKGNKTVQSVLNQIPIF